MTELPDRVIEGTFWTIENDGSTSIVADFAFDNGAVTSISLTSASADLSQIRGLLDVVVSRLPEYEARVAAVE